LDIFAAPANQEIGKCVSQDTSYHYLTAAFIAVDGKGKSSGYTLKLQCAVKKEDLLAEISV